MLISTFSLSLDLTATKESRGKVLSDSILVLVPLIMNFTGAKKAACSGWKTLINFRCVY